MSWKTLLALLVLVITCEPAFASNDGTVSKRTVGTCILKNDDPSCSNVDGSMQAFCPDYATDVGVQGKPEYGCNAKMCKPKDQKYETRLHQAMFHGMFGGASGSDRICNAWCLYDVEEQNRHFRWNNKKGCWNTRKTRQRACKDSTKEERGFAADVFDSFCAAGSPVILPTPVVQRLLPVTNFD